MTTVEEQAVSLETLERTGALTPTHLELPDGITRDQFEALGHMLGTYKESLHWAIGDWLAHGEKLWGEEMYQYADALGISVASRSQYIRVATQIAPSRRIEKLSWTHHRQVGFLEPKEQTRFLKLAVKNDWTKRQLAEAVAEYLGKQPRKSKSHVIEAVAAAAEVIWEEAERFNGQGFIVPEDPMLELGRLLGHEDPE